MDIEMSGGGSRHMNWRYDPGEHRTKHCGHGPAAIFVEVGGKTIGKCPSTIDRATAERLLNEGIVLEGTQEAPEKIVNVLAGVIYIAVPTEPGISFHGYPWRYRPGMQALPRKILAELRARAEQSGHGRQFKQWVNDHGQ